MSKRTRIHPVQFYLSDDEQYILEEKYRLSKMKSKSAFLRKMILYGFVYEVDYSHIRKMNTLLGNISSNLNQITRRINSTNTVYQKDLDDIKEFNGKNMAVTKIHGIKTTVDKAIEYICNPDKTDQKLYISSFACSPETAALDFKYTLDHTHDRRDPYNANKAFHLIQAFSPDEVSYKEAHQIGKELADRLLDGKYSYVLTTHIDKDHVHNHLIFCSADNITFSHYHDCKKNYWKIRNLSDTLCQEHNLSTIMPDGKKGMKYNEWAANKSESSKKAQLRKNINQTIRIVSTYSDFLSFMEAKGYEIKNAEFGETSRKYITFRSLDMSRPVRDGIRRKTCVVHYRKNTHICCKNIFRHAEKTDCTSVTLRSIIGMRFKLPDT